MAQRPLRFGIHDFLNAGPLLIPLSEKGADAGLRMVIDAPPALADRLKAGELDLAMIPSVEYLREGDAYRLIPDVCIASRGPVGTVLLLTQKPVDKIRSVAVDIRSRTSVALLDILFEFGPDVTIHSFLPEPTTMLAEHDAALIIGDRALILPILMPNLTIYDLSEEWFKKTGKTFVHAVVAVRSGIAIDRATVKFIQEVKLEGCGRIEEIVRGHRELEGANLRVCEDYLKQKIRYDLGTEEEEGLAHFRDLCYERGLIPGKTSIRFA